MPTKEAAELQHSREFVEEQDAAVMRQTPVAKGDFHISRRSTHPDLNLTKSDVKVTMKICSGSPARSVRNSHPMPFFTPDSGFRVSQHSSTPSECMKPAAIVIALGYTECLSSRRKGRFKTGKGIG